VSGAGYPFLVRAIRLVVRLYFRRVEVSGLEQIPGDGGGVLVAWHPNALIDGFLILTSFPRRVSFGARHGLFRVPGLGALLRGMNAVPIYRPQDLGRSDDGARRGANRESLDTLARRVAGGSFACLFPEGLSHDAPHPVEVRPGAARLYLRASALLPPGAPRPVILPVGLHYNSKRLFRSEAHVVFHPPFVPGTELEPIAAAEEPAEPEAMRVQSLTAAIERALHETANATDDWETHFLLSRVRKLVRAERAARAGTDPGRPSLVERTSGFARVRRAYLRQRERAPDQVAALRERVDRYDRDLRALGMEDHLLDRAPRLASPRLVALLLLQVAAVFLLLPPFLLAGYVVNGPPALLLWALVRGLARERKDEATLKILLGVPLFPLAWVLAGAAAWRGHLALHQAFPRVPDVPWLAAAATVLLGVVGGLVVLMYHEVAGETARAVRVRLIRGRRWFSIGRLRKERAAIFDQVMALADGPKLAGLETAPPP
jgi:1-acyl-sn-glycerol-3-phosphate acyltransferase